MIHLEGVFGKFKLYMQIIHCIVFYISSLEKKFHNKQFCPNMWNIQDVM